jgi:hypothetical protein
MDCPWAPTDHEGTTGQLTDGQYHDRVLVTPVCASFLAHTHGFQITDSFMKRNALGRPYYYSHFTDYYRCVAYTYT